MSCSAVYTGIYLDFYFFKCGLFMPIASISSKSRAMLSF